MASGGVRGAAVSLLVEHDDGAIPQKASTQAGIESAAVNAPGMSSSGISGAARSPCTSEVQIQAVDRQVAAARWSFHGCWTG